MASIGQWTGGTASTLPTTSWAAPDAAILSTQSRNDGSAYSFAYSTSTLTLPSSSLAKGYLIRCGVEFEDTSDGRHSPVGRIVQTSGTGNFLSLHSSGYNRYNSEDRAYLQVVAFVDSPSAAAEFQFQWRRDADAPLGGTVQAVFEVTAMDYANVGMFTGNTPQDTTGSTPVTVGFDTTVYNSGGMSLASDTVTLGASGKRYLVLGSVYGEDWCDNRTIRVGQFEYGGTIDHNSVGYCYLRHAKDADQAVTLWSLHQSAAASESLRLKICEGTYGNGYIGAEASNNVTPSLQENSLVVIELNDSAEVFASHDSSCSPGTVNQAISGVDTDNQIALEAVAAVDIADSASFVKATATGVDAQKAMDAFVFGAVAGCSGLPVPGTVRNTQHSFITVNGTREQYTQDGAYHRGDQLSTGTDGMANRPGGILALAANDELGIKASRIVGGETGAVSTVGVSLFAINLDTLSATGGDTAQTSTTTISVGSTATQSYSTVFAGLSITPIAEYVLNEASSGTSVTQVLDSSGNGNHLDDCGYTNGNWTSIAAGSGFQSSAVNGGDGPYLRNLDFSGHSGNLYTAFQGATTASFICVVQVDAYHTNYPRIFQMGGASENGAFAATIGHDNSTDRISIRVNDLTYLYDLGTVDDFGVHVFHGVLDTTQDTPAARMRVWRDGVELTQTGGNANSTGIVLESTDDFVVFNRGDGVRSPDGALYYLALFNEKLTAGDIAASYTQLVNDNDTSLIVGAVDVTQTSTTTVSISNTATQVYTNVAVDTAQSSTTTISVSNTATQVYTNVAVDTAQSSTTTISVGNTAAQSYGNSAVEVSHPSTTTISVGNTATQTYTNVAVDTPQTSTTTISVGNSATQNYTNVPEYQQDEPATVFLGNSGTQLLVTDNSENFESNFIISDQGSQGLVTDQLSTTTITVGNTATQSYTNVAVNTNQPSTTTITVGNTATQTYDNVAVDTAQDSTTTISVVSTATQSYDNVAVDTAQTSTTTISVSNTATQSYTNVAVDTAQSSTTTITVGNTATQTYDNVAVDTPQSSTTTIAVSNTATQSYTNVALAISQPSTTTISVGSTAFQVHTGAYEYSNILQGSYTTPTLVAVTPQSLTATGTVQTGGITLYHALSCGGLTAEGEIASGSLGISQGLSAGNLVATGSIQSGSTAQTVPLQTQALSATGSIQSGAAAQTHTLQTEGLESTGAIASANTAVTHLLAAGALSNTGEIASGTIVQTQQLATSALESTGGIQSGFITQEGQLGALPLTATGTIGSAAIAQTQELSAGSLETSGSVQSADITQTQSLSASSLETSGSLQSAEITQTHTLSTTGVSTTGSVSSVAITPQFGLVTSGLSSTPSIAAGEIAQTQTLATTGLTASPDIATATITQTISLSAGAIETTGTVSAASLTFTVSLVADPLAATGQLESAEIVQTQALTTAAGITGPPAIAAGSIVIHYSYELSNVESIHDVSRIRLFIRAELSDIDGRALVTPVAISQTQTVTLGDVSYQDSVVYWPVFSPSTGNLEIDYYYPVTESPPRFPGQTQAVVLADVTTSGGNNVVVVSPQRSYSGSIELEYATLDKDDSLSLGLEYTPIVLELKHKR